MKRVKQYFEYDKINFEQECFSDAEIVAIQRFSEKASYYDLTYRGLRFKQFVGVLQIGQLTIEVLPKIDRQDNNKEKWRDVLLNMLLEVRLMQPESTGLANLRLRANSILELYFSIFLAELQKLLRQGLIKKYRTERGNQHSLNGKLLFHEHIKHNLVHAERFYTEHSTYDSHHELHQILHQALQVVHKMTAGSSLENAAEILLQEWPQSKPVFISEDVFKRIPVNRKTMPYQTALQIAKLILLNYHPDLRNGKSNVLALMFDMNSLWEKFIFSRIQSCGREHDWRVKDQVEWCYWRGDAGSKKVIPDIVIEFPDGKRAALDTKWKLPVQQKPDDNDLRQLLTYKMYFEADHAYLIYPCHGVESFTIPGAFHSRSHQESLIFKEGFTLHGGLIYLNTLLGDKLISRPLFAAMFHKLLF